MICILCLCVWGHMAYAQSVPDSLRRRNPTRALLWGILPGGGQLYNKEVWKWPIIIGVGAVMGYYIGYQNRIYQTLKVAVRNEIDDDPNTINRLDQFSEATLRNGAEVFRRNRDLLIIIASVVYVLQGVEAYVSAHLKGFDTAFGSRTQQKLSMGLQVEPIGNTLAYVCRLRLTL